MRRNIHLAALAIAAIACVALASGRLLAQTSDADNTADAQRQGDEDLGQESEQAADSDERDDDRDRSREQDDDEQGLRERAAERAQRIRERASRRAERLRERASQRDDDEQQQQNRDPKDLESLGATLRESSQHEQGVEVARIERDSPLAEAGLERGDLIVSVDGRRVGSREQLEQQVARAESPEDVRLEVVRDGQRRTVVADLSGDAGDQRLADRAEELGERLGERVERFTQRLGERASELAEEMEEELEEEDLFDGEGLFDDDRPQRRRGRPALGVQLQEGSRGEVWISRVEPDSPAEAAGLRRGDQLLTINGSPVTSPDRLVSLIEETDPRDDVLLQIVRDGRRRRVSATLASRQEVFDDDRRAPSEERERYGESRSRGRDARTARSNRGALGVTVDDDGRGDVWIESLYPGGPAEEAGLRPDDQILAIQGRDVRSAMEVVRLLGRMRADEQVELEIARNGRRRTVEATLAPVGRAFSSAREYESPGRRISREERGDDRDDGRYERFYRGRATLERDDDDRMDDEGFEEERFDEDRFGEELRQDTREFGGEVLENLGERIFNDDQ